MADLARIRALGIRRVTQKKMGSANWGDVVGGFQAASAPDRQSFARAISGGSAASVQKIARRVLRDFLQAEAIVEVDAALSDSSLTLQELEDLFL